MRYRGSLVVCQFAHSKKKCEQPNGQMKKAMPCKWKMREILQISFIVPSTLILHWLWTLYILKVGGVHWLVTNQKSWILYWIQMNILHFHVNVLYCKSNFLISIQYIKHRWKNGAHMPRKTIKILCNNLIVRRGDMCPLMRKERINVYDMDLSYVLEAQQFNWFY